MLRFMILSAVLLTVLPVATRGACQGWEEVRIRLLPDTSFALIEYDAGRKVRRCPHHDLNGRLDPDQLVYVLGTLDDEAWITPSGMEAARKHLEKHYHACGFKSGKAPITGRLNLNEAALTDLVRLPLIGPVLAVKIVEYRLRRLRFQTVDEMVEIDGIGPGILSAIRHYITIAP